MHPSRVANCSGTLLAGSMSKQLGGVLLVPRLVRMGDYFEHSYCSIGAYVDLDIYAN